MEKFLNKMWLRITYEDGKVETICDDAKSVRSRYDDLVSLYNQHYFGKVKIELLDYGEKVWKVFIQYY